MLRLPAIAFVDREHHRSTLGRRDSNVDGSPVRDLLLGNGPEGVETGNTRWFLRGAGLATITAAAAFASPASALLRRCLSDSAIDERVRPRERDRHRREHDDEEGNAGPEPDDVVPVEVASLAAKAAAEQHNWPNALPRPPAREPQVEARAHDEQEKRVRPTGDGARERPAFAFDREPAMPGPD